VVGGRKSKGIVSLTASGGDLEKDDPTKTRDARATTPMKTVRSGFDAHAC